MMQKMVKKLWLPSSALFTGPAVDGGGAPATIFTPSAGALNGDDANSNLSFRIICMASVDSLGKLKVTFASSTVAPLGVSHASIAKWANSGDNADATTTPVELKFSGASGFLITAGGTITSDACDHSSAFGIAAGDGILVIYDVSATPGQGGERFRGSMTNCTTWFGASEQFSWNVQTVSSTEMGFTKVANKDYAIAQIDTE